MKKIIATILVLLLLCQFAGCGQGASVDKELQGQWSGTLGWGEYRITLQFEDGNFSYENVYSIWVDEDYGTYEILDDTIVLTFSGEKSGSGDKTMELEYRFEDGELRLWLEGERLTRRGS